MTPSHTGHAPATAAHERRHASMARSHYGRLLAMIVLSFLAMYVLMYAMVNAFDNAYVNINNAYMAGLMAAPMLVIELAVMSSMYSNRKLNAALIAAGLLLVAVLCLAIRQQAAVGDAQFLRSMIPHHASAVLMCRKAPIEDAEIKALCRQIISSQQREIEQMKNILARPG